MEEFKALLQELCEAYFSQAESDAYSEVELRSCSHVEFSEVVREWAAESLQDDIADVLDKLRDRLYCKIAEV